MPRVLIIIPAFNEEANIGDVITDIRTHQPDAGIVVVDDGSTDKTVERAGALGVNVLRLPINLGIGGAVQTGFLFACKHGYSCAIQVDGDGQHPASEIATLLAALASEECAPGALATRKPDSSQEGRADVVIGSRFLSAEGFRSTAPRRAGIWIFRYMSRLITGQTITDNTSGFRAYNEPAMKFLAENYPSDFPEVESIIVLRRNRFRIREVAVSMRERQGGQSSITLGRSIYYMVKVILASLVSNLKPVRRGRT